MKIKFYPILKTKNIAERHIIKKFSNELFSDNTVPIIEFIKEKDNRITKNFIFSLENISYIGGMSKINPNYSLLSSIEYAKFLLDESRLVIPFCFINNKTKSDELKELFIFISNVHTNRRNIALWIENTVDISIISSFKNYIKLGDLLFIDIVDDSYHANKFYFNDVFDIGFSTPISLIYRDKNPSLSGKGFACNDLDYNFNNEVPTLIKSNTFDFDGFGTYCTARDNLTDTSIPVKVYPLLSLYNFASNKYFTFKSDIPEYITKAYTTLKTRIKSDSTLRSKLYGLLENTPISKSLYQNIEYKDQSKNNTASEFIEVSIVHFIEEIKKGLHI